MPAELSVLFKTIKVVYTHKQQFVDPNQFLANAKKLIFPSKVLIITSLSLRRDLSVSLKAATSPSAVAVQGRLGCRCGNRVGYGKRVSEERESR